MIHTWWVHPRRRGPRLEAKGGTEGVHGEELILSGMQVSMSLLALAQSSRLNGTRAVLSTYEGQNDTC